MPGPITHLNIADRLLRITVMPLDACSFVAGSIAPDAIMAIPSYNYTLKKRAHLR